MASSHPHRNIILSGFMGAGKSTIGPALARELGWAFLDTDAFLVGREAMSVAEIFERKGEAHFRRLESDLLRDLSRHQGQVIALGGGALLSSENREVVNAMGLLTYLRARVDTLFERLKAERQARPLLTGIGSDAELAQRIESLLGEREPIYQQARLILDVDDKHPNSVVAEILQGMRRVQ